MCAIFSDFHKSQYFLRFTVKMVPLLFSPAGYWIEPCDKEVHGHMIKYLFRTFLKITSLYPILSHNAGANLSLVKI